MKYKILKGTTLFDKLTELHAEMQRVIRAVDPILDAFGTTRYARKRGVLAGGIAALELKSPPLKWVRIGKKWDNLYYPGARCPDRQTIEALPTLPYSALNDLVGFEEGETVITRDGGMRWLNCPGVIWEEDVILMEVNDGSKYKPSDSAIIEVTVSEWKSLQTREEEEPVDAGEFE